MLFERFREAEEGCGCRPSADGDRLVVDAEGCEQGDLSRSPDCRAAVVGALAGTAADTVLVRAGGRERAYEEAGAALLAAAGRFVDRAAFHDEVLAGRARRDPLAAGRDAAGRAGPVARIARDTGLAAAAARFDGYGAALRPYVGPTVAGSRVTRRPPPDARLVERRDDGAVARVYERPGEELRVYHLHPVEQRLDDDAMATLADAHEALASGAVDGGERAPGRAVREVAAPEDPVETLAGVLEKHTRGHGVLADLFADPGCSDAFLTAPAGERPLRVRVEGETMRTNVRVTGRGAEALASRYRRTSGRSFSRSDPTLAATGRAGGRRIRVAGVAAPASDGVAFAVRAHDRGAWTLPALVANDTLPSGPAALLGLAVERGAACLLAGARGAGKTTTLGALCFELPAATRAVVIEDTPELPVERLREAGRDVQALRVGTGPEAPLAPAEALRTALRMGDGALVVGEVRGEEAPVLFEAMRVGAADGAVLGTVHGEGGAAVRDRLVADCGIDPAAVGATDLVVTLERTPEGRRVTRIEEVVGDPASFRTLHEYGPDGLAPTGRIARGNSRLVAGLAPPDGGYADVRAALGRRAERLERLAAAGRTGPDAVVEAGARRRCDG